MSPADAEEVAALSGQLGYPAAAADIAARQAAIAAEPERGVALVAEHATAGGGDVTRRIDGWAHVELRHTLVASPAAQLMALVVVDGERGRGVGRDLLLAAEAWAVARGAQTLTVATRITREDAHRFYRREGYELDKTSHIFTKPLA